MFLTIILTLAVIALLFTTGYFMFYALELEDELFENGITPKNQLRTKLKGLQ